MRLSCLLLGCFFSLCVFAGSSKKTYGNIKEAQGNAIKAPLSMMGVDVDSGNSLNASSKEKNHSVGDAVDGEAMGEMCLSPETTMGDAGSSLSFEFTEPKPLLPAGKDDVYIQNGRVVFRDSQLDPEKSYCKLMISQKNISTSMQLIESPIKVEEVKDKIEDMLHLEKPFVGIFCISYPERKTEKISDLRISEFKKIVGDAMRINLNCSKLGASKSNESKDAAKKIKDSN
ncbi:MAG: hypothetical protein WCK43_07915 [bacterium]